MQTATALTRPSILPVPGLLCRVLAPGMPIWGCCGGFRSGSLISGLRDLRSQGIYVVVGTQSDHWKTPSGSSGRKSTRRPVAAFYCKYPYIRFNARGTNCPPAGNLLVHYISHCAVRSSCSVSRVP